jgi:hypothetical protein
MGAGELPAPRALSRRKFHATLEPCTQACDGRDVTDRWIIYGAFGRQNNHQVFASKRLVFQPDVRYRLQDPVGSDLLVVQGMGTVGALAT